MNISQDLYRGSLLFLALSLGAIMAGCNEKETLLDVDTPSGGVEVQQDSDTGRVDVEVESEE